MIPLPGKELLQRLSELAAKHGGLRVYSYHEAVKLYDPVHGVAHEPLLTFPGYVEALAYFERLEFPIHSSGS